MPWIYDESVSQRLHIGEGTAQTRSRGNTSVSAGLLATVCKMCLGLQSQHLTIGLLCAIAENLQEMDTHFDGVLQKSDMEKFREGSYEEASSTVQAAWKMVMMKFLPKICRGWGKKMEEILLSEYSETTKEMEALVCWYVDMYGDSRWEKEHKADEQTRMAGGKIDRRGKRAGENRKQGAIVFMKYWKLVTERRPASKDWDQALLDAAKEERSAAETGDVEEGSGQPQKKQRKEAPEPVIPTAYRFTNDGELTEIASI